MNAALALVASALAAVLPTILYVFIVWRVDRYEKEPLGLVAAAFLWGAIPALLLSFLAEIIVGMPLALVSQGYEELIAASVVAPPVEEVCKGLALGGVYILARREFDDVLDGIIYGSVIGFGFAMTENLAYFVSAWHDGGLSHWSGVVLGRAVAFGFNHAMFTALTGVGLGLARYQRSRFKRGLLILMGLGAAIVAHFLHNVFISAGGWCLLSFAVDWVGVLVLLVIVLLTWSKERELMRTQLAEEVADGLLTPQQLETIVSRRNRLAREWRLLGISGLAQARLYRQLVATATELAFKKHQRARMGEERGNSAAIAALRGRLVDLRARLGDPVAPDPRTAGG